MAVFVRKEKKGEDFHVYMLVLPSDDGNDEELFSSPASPDVVPAPPPPSASHAEKEWDAATVVAADGGEAEKEEEEPEAVPRLAEEDGNEAEKENRGTDTEAKMEARAAEEEDGEKTAAEMETDQEEEDDEEGEGPEAEAEMDEGEESAWGPRPAGVASMSTRPRSQVWLTCPYSVFHVVPCMDIQAHCISCPCRPFNRKKLAQYCECRQMVPARNIEIHRQFCRPYIESKIEKYANMLVDLPEDKEENWD